MARNRGYYTDEFEEIVCDNAIRRLSIKNKPRIVISFEDGTEQEYYIDHVGYKKECLGIFCLTMNGLRVFFDFNDLSDAEMFLAIMSLN